MDTSKTQFYKGRDGWNAKDTIDLGAATSAGRTGTRMLEISTYKRSRGGIHTRVNCHIVADGCTIFEVFGDYNKTVATIEGAKCTEKAVKTLHATVMAQQADAIVAEARDFYAKKDAAKALHAKRDEELAALDKKSAFDYPEVHAAGCTG
jgi:hypothetical protein